MRKLTRAFGLALAEKLPLVGTADVNGDGNLQLVLGPQARGVTGKTLKEMPDKTVSVGPVVLVLGVR